MLDVANKSAVPIYSPGSDTFLEELALKSDRVWYFEKGLRAFLNLKGGKEADISGNIHMIGGSWRQESKPP